MRSIRGRDKRQEESQGYVLRQTDGHLEGWRWCLGDGDLEKGREDELEPSVITRDGCTVPRGLCTG